MEQDFKIKSAADLPKQKPKNENDKCRLAKMEMFHSMKLEQVI